MAEGDQLSEDRQTEPAGADGGAAGDGATRQTIADLVKDHHQVLFRYAYRLSGSAADAEDLTQQTFLIAQQKIDQVREVGSRRSWLFTVLRNCFLKSCRRRGPALAEDIDLDVEAVAQPAAVNGLEEGPLDGQKLQAAIDSLPDEFRLVVLMFYFEELSYKEIAEKLELPIGTVMSRLSRAKTRLRSALTADVRQTS
jgi:RNA polymerase sigma-70 factor (ECF subfamily)